MSVKDDRRKRLSLAEKRALTAPLNLGPEFRQPEAAQGAETVAHWSDIDIPDASHKTPISLRVDPEVLEFFKAQGPRYQTRMNAVLRAYMEARKKLSRP
jgi:uncharacterized protein (DUF4415 family)